MNDKKRLFAGILVFGSLWGFSECIIGSLLHDQNMPAGAIMTGVFAIGFMTLSRIWYKQPGMQFGMGLVAGMLRLFNPVGGCFICSAIAIMAEGMIFEIIWYKISLHDLREYKPSLLMCSSIGIVSAYLIYVSGYVITQIFTPFFSSAGFYVENLVVFLPQIFAGGLLAALLGAIIVPTLILSVSLNLKVMDKRLYYPTTLGISVVCWVVVIANTCIVFIG